MEVSISSSLNWPRTERTRRSALTEVVDRVLVGEQCPGPTAQVHQAVPIGAVARQASDLEADHDTDLSTAHGGRHAFEAGARASDAGGAPLVLIDDHDALAWPSGLDGPVRASVLAALALTVMLDLMRRGLAHVDVGRTLQVFCLNFVK